MKKILKLILSTLSFSLSLFANAQQKNRLQLIDTSVLKIPKPQLTQIGNYNQILLLVFISCA